jgi:ribonuclease HII
MEFASNGMVIGVDEVGKGSWAGPMIVVAFAAPVGWSLKGLKDSKQYDNHTQRKKIYDVLQDVDVGFCCARCVEARDIDAVGMGHAHRKAIREAIEICMNMLCQSCPGLPERIIVDGDGRQPFAGVECIPKADDLFQQVSAASVIAKVIHDDKMILHSLKYPGYDFESNMGYGTKKHKQGIVDNGLCPLHRRSFSPMKDYLASSQVELPSTHAKPGVIEHCDGDVYDISNARAAKSLGRHGHGTSGRGVPIRRRTGSRQK